MKNASAKLKRKIRGKVYRELSSDESKFKMKSSLSYKDREVRHKRK
ncbi:hypothetical protein HYV11_01770 [Candidatus Dependentiae bacterium]|nr:hypothetical protein [Candidatus Dependentiae bacterium]